MSDIKTIAVTKVARGSGEWVKKRVAFRPDPHHPEEPDMTTQMLVDQFVLCEPNKWKYVVYSLHFKNGQTTTITETRHFHQ